MCILIHFFLFFNWLKVKMILLRDIYVDYLFGASFQVLCTCLPTRFRMIHKDSGFSLNHRDAYENDIYFHKKTFSLLFWISEDTYKQGLYKDRHSYGRSTMSTQLVGVFNFPISKFEEGKSATRVAFCH